MRPRTLVACVLARPTRACYLALSTAVLATLGMWVVPAISQAQSTLGTIRGTVADPQRQVTPGVAILATDQDTGVSRATETDAHGNYELADLRAGTYRLRATLSGFKTDERVGIALGAGEAVRVNVTLEIGQTSQTITVTAEGSALQLESQAIQSALDPERIRDLPRSGRDLQDLLALNPNVVDSGAGFQFLGGRTYGALYVQDGQRSTGAIFGEIGNAAPGLEAIAEVKVLSSSYGAEFGGLAGVVVTTRRGSNRYSGSGFYDFNSDELNALTYSQTLAGLKRGFPGSDTRHDRFGGVFGGPLKRDRAFFFASYEGSNQTQVLGSTPATVPTERMRNGDFSANTYVIRDPLTGLPFPGNVIPQRRIHRASRATTGPSFAAAPAISIPRRPPKAFATPSRARRSDTTSRETVPSTQTRSRPARSPPTRGLASTRWTSISKAPRPCNTT